MKFGVYQIRNLVNGKVYIGKSKNLQSRKSGHFASLRKGLHANKHLQNSYNKYGEKSFVFEIVEYVDNEEKLIEREQFWIDKVRSRKENFEYNIRKQAESNEGLKHTEASKKKISLFMKGLRVGEKNPSSKLNQKQVEEMIHLFFDKQVSYSELVRKFSVSKSTIQDALNNRTWKMVERSGRIAGQFSPQTRWKGKKHSEKSLKMIAEASSGSNNPFFGKKHTRETLKKISDKTRGENHPKAKLTWEKVREIRKLYLTKEYTQLEIAKMYLVSKPTIQGIIENRYWKE